MRSTTAVLIVSLLALHMQASPTEAASTASVGQEAAAWRKVADTIPLGSKIVVHTFDGRRVRGTLMRVDDTTVMIKKSTRLPEAPVTVTFDQLSMIERDRGGGMNWAKALGVGAAAGAAAILTIFVIALQFD